LGLPGVLPVLNRQALEWGIRVGLAFDCEIAEVMRFDRKHYFYPDLPKGYQISQYDHPLARYGRLDIDSEGGKHTVRLRRIHLEEDAGKSLHENRDGVSLVDFNRAGIPLLEIVSEPDIRSSDEAHQYLTALKNSILYLDVSDCNMEEGSLRCDVNVSLRAAGSQTLGTRVEIKNLNSFRAVRMALDYEIQRQQQVLQEGGAVVQETRLWNERKLITEPMRGKEDAADYRYFPEPDLVPFVIDRALVERIRVALPELPAARKQRLMQRYSLSEYDAGVLTAQRKLADLFEKALAVYDQPKALVNWIMGDLSAYLNSKQLTIEDITLQPEWLAHLVQLIDKGTITGKIAKDLLIKVIEQGKDPEGIVQSEGLQQIADTGALEAIVTAVIAEHPKVVDEVRAGKETALQFLVGQGMRRSKGKANPQQLIQLLKQKLG
jgi:aspartyl-tRNA(Asn)/glutamyl-tRNA(Gln) amidotransferase subunit B